MIVSKAITGTAVLPITGAGESGSAWLHEDDTGAEGQADVRIYHKDPAVGGAPSIATIRSLGKRLYKPIGNIDVMTIGADSATDIFYAVCKNDEDKATALVDVV